MPEDKDWKGILRYNHRIQSLKYDERFNDVSPTVFPVFEAYNVKHSAYLFPNLRDVAFEIDSQAGLERCRLFFSPQLDSIQLNVGVRCSQLSPILVDMASRTTLSTFELRSQNTLPPNFSELLRPQVELEGVTILAPGAINVTTGVWLASLKKLRFLELDLARMGGPKVDVQGFFGKDGERSTSPHSSHDSGVFSGEDTEVIEDKKKRVRSVSRRGPFEVLEHLVLGGSTVLVAMFLDNLSADVSHLDVSIEDQPLESNWKKLATQICLSFAGSLKELRVRPAQTSRFAEIVKSSSRASAVPPPRRLSLFPLHPLATLTKLDLDLPESAFLTDQDVQHLSRTCPNLQELRLLPLAKYPTPNGPPKLTLGTLASLVENCRQLHTLAMVINAATDNVEALLSGPDATSDSLHNLRLGHSWIQDSLQVAIVIAHLAPRLKNLKWFSEKNRPGYIEANAHGWEEVAYALSLLQDLVSRERRNSSLIWEHIAVPEEVEMEIEMEYVEFGIQCQPETLEAMVGAAPDVADAMVGATPDVVDAMVEAVPDVVDAIVDAIPVSRSISVEAVVDTSEMEVDATPATRAKSVQAWTSTKRKNADIPNGRPRANGIKQHADTPLLFTGPLLPMAWIVLGLLTAAMSTACRVFILYPLSIPSRITRTALGVPLYVLNRIAPKAREEEAAMEVRQDAGSPSVCS